MATFNKTCNNGEKHKLELHNDSLSNSIDKKPNLHQDHVAQKANLELHNINNSQLSHCVDTKPNLDVCSNDDSQLNCLNENPNVDVRNNIEPHISHGSTNDCQEELFNGVKISKLTKTQMKKYKRMLQWQATKKEKRAKERLKTKKKIKEAKMMNIDLGPSRKQLKDCKMANSSCKTGIVIDLSFDDLMINKDMGKVIKQILRVYTMNRRSKTPMQLHLTSFTGRSKEEMSKHNGYENWDMYIHEEDYLNVFPKEKLVYLSSESNNVIKELEQDKVYIIGGLVDHNSHKGICYSKAVEQGIAHGQLPIAEYFNMKTRKVFTINQVFEILLGVIEGKSFKDAFEDVLPKRINMKPTSSIHSILSQNECSSDDSTDDVELLETSSTCSLLDSTLAASPLCNNVKDFNNK